MTAVSEEAARLSRQDVGQVHQGALAPSRFPVPPRRKREREREAGVAREPAMRDATHVRTPSIEYVAYSIFKKALGVSVRVLRRIEY